MLIYDQSQGEFVDEYRRASKGVSKNVLQETKVGFDETENKMVVEGVVVPKHLYSVVFHPSC